MLRGPPSAPTNERLRLGDHLAPLPTKTLQPHHNNEAPGEQLATPATRIALLQCYSNAASHCRNGVLLQCLSALLAIPVSMLVLPQYCRNADAACNALQHCRNTYCRNIEAHCRNAPFVASLQQCYYCKGRCGNALWHCCNTPIFSRCRSRLMGL